MSQRLVIINVMSAYDIVDAMLLIIIDNKIACEYQPHFKYQRKIWYCLVKDE